MGKGKIKKCSFQPGEEIITDINSLLVKYNVQFYSKSYNEVLNEAPENSVIYIDPPYYESFGMYYGEFDFNEFNTNINKYADKYRKVIISFDNKPVDEIIKDNQDRTKEENTNKEEQYHLIKKKKETEAMIMSALMKEKQKTPTEQAHSF